MAEKLIIDNRTDRTLPEIWAHLGAVLCQGASREKGKTSVFNDGLMVASVVNERSERLLVSEWQSSEEVKGGDPNSAAG